LLPPDKKALLDEARRRGLVAGAAAQEEPEPERTFGGYAKEAFKGIIPGVAGLAETAITGAAALLPEEQEQAVRGAVAGVTEPIREYFAPAPGYEDTFVRKVSEGVGSTLPFLPLGLAGALGRVAATGLGVSAGAGEARQRAEEAGATDEQRATATALGIAPGALEALPPIRILRRFGFGDDAVREVAGTIPALKRIARAGGEEALQEASSEVLQNLIAKGVYAPDEAVFGGVGEAAAVGGGAGAVVSAIAELALGRRARGPEGEAPEEPPAAPVEPEAPPAPQLNPEAVQTAQDYMTRVDAGEEKFNWMKGRKMLREMGVDIPSEAKAADVRNLLNQSLQREAPVPVTGVDIESILTGEFVPEVQRGVPRPVEEVVTEPSGGGIAVPPSGRAATGSEATELDLTGVGVPETPAVPPVSGEGRVEPALIPEAAAAAPVEVEPTVEPEVPVTEAEPLPQPAFRRPETLSNAAISLKDLAKTTYNLGALDRTGYMAVVGELNKESPDIRVIKDRLTKAAKAAGMEVQTAKPRLDTGTRKFMLDKKGDRDALTQIADLMLQNAPSDSETFDYAQDYVDPLGMSKEEIKSKPGMNARRMAKMLGPQLYGDPSDMGEVTVKEILQNSFDSIKGMIDSGELAKGKIDIDVDPDNRVVRMTDNGRGMTPELLGTRFLEIAGTGKDAKTPSGGFGIAKMLFLYGNKGIKVTTMRDGKVAEMVTNGDQLFDALENPEVAPVITVRDPTEEDLQKFPDGHGTDIALTIPENFVDPATGETKDIQMVRSTYDLGALTRSPLFADIDVSFNNRRYGYDPDPVEIGSKFPYDKYTEFTNVKFPWGTARVYVAPSESTYGSNLHVLSNGLYQFSQRVSKEPLNIYSQPVPFEFYVDIKPTVKPEDAGYPFTFNRKDLTDVAKRDYGKIMQYINALYAYQSLSDSAASFGSMQYLESPTSVTPPIDVKPTVPPAQTAFAGIQQGDQVTVKDGKLFIEGRELPELTPAQLEQGIPKSDQLKVDPSLIDGDRIMMHDNVQFIATKQPFSDYMREQYGNAYNSFLFEVGEVFKDLRNDVVKILGSDYDGLLDQAVGISIDQEYRGVSTRVPFEGSFINPFATRSVNPIEGAYGALGTMIHELAHFKVRNHNADFPAEMQFIDYKLQAADRNKFNAYQDKLVNAFTKYQDIFENGWRVINESRSIEARGDRFKDGSREDAGKPADEGIPSGKRGPSRAGRAGERVQPSGERGGKPAGKRGAAAERGKPDEGVKAVKKKVAEAKPKETPDQFKDRRVSQLNNKFNKNTLVHRIGKYFSGEDAGSRRVDLYERAVKFFQNEIRPLQQLEQGLRQAKKLIVGAPGFNNAFSIISSAQDKAAYYSSTILKQPMDAAYKAIETYAKMRNFDTNKALEELDRFRIIMHEPERRDVMYMLNVPLSTKRRKFISPGGKVQRISPAEIRQEILKRLITPADLVSNGQAKAMGDTLRKIVSDPANIDPLGDSPLAEPGKPVPTDKNDRVYNVLGGYSPEFIAQLKADMDGLNPDVKAAAEAAVKAVNDVQEATKELNRKAKYWSKPVDNIVAFYDFKAYAPLKGRPDKSEAAKLDPNDRRVSGEMAEAAQAMEGRQSEAENSILQSFSDAYYAAARAGREGATEAVKNLIEQGHIKGKLVGKITMADRYLNRDFSMKPFKGENKIFHHNDDGTIEVYQIAPQDLRILQAIRRPYQESNWATRAGNAVTGFIGQMHTRFNPSFAPLNFPRDVITNTLFIAGDYSAGDARRYFTDALVRNVMKGGLYKSGKISTLIEKGDINKVRELAKKDDFVRDTLEWIERGGRTAYQQSYSIGAQAVALDESLGKKGVVAATKRGLEQVAAVMDIYNDAFEFTNRVAAYAMARNKAQAQLIKDFTDANKRKPNAKEMEQIEEAAKTEGASFAKNLANFRLVGDAGREAGALFMFFRPAATGAVRAIDTLLPALVSFETALSKQPESIQKDPEAVKNFRKDYEAQKTRARWTMFVTAAAGAFLYELALAGADDDEQGRNKIATDDMARWTRYARMPVLGEDTMLQIPWGFGVSAFGAFGAQMAALARGNVVAKDAMANTINIAFDSFIPIPKSNINVFDNFAGFLVDSVTPSALRPFVEYAMNTDSLGNQIYNNRQSRYSDVFTGGSNIPEFYKMLARNYFEMTGFEVSPNTVYFWTSNYVDALGRVATSTYDLRLFASGDREFRSVDDLDRVVPFIDSFIGTRSNYDARQYADVEKQVQKKMQILNSLKFRPDEYTRHVEKNPADEEMVKFYERAIRTDLAKLREDANFIRNTSELSTQQKRDLLKENTRMQNLAKRNLIDSFKIYYGIEPK
jgi:outer membrane murein-binding lipoprotein Lpp